MSLYNFIVQSVKPWLGPENDNNIHERSRLFINAHMGSTLSEQFALPVSCNNPKMLLHCYLFPFGGRGGKKAKTVNSLPKVTQRSYECNRGKFY